LQRKYALLLADELLKAHKAGQFTIRLQKQDDPNVIVMTIDVGGLFESDLKPLIDALANHPEISYTIDKYSVLTIYDEPKAEETQKE
jgi:hypothetical protein